jgi:hypothetical protein
LSQALLFFSLSLSRAMSFIDVRVSYAVESEELDSLLVIKKKLSHKCARRKQSKLRSNPTDER